MTNSFESLPFLLPSVTALSATIYVFPLLLPPLRERLDDIPVLVEHFASQIAGQNGWKAKKFLPDAIEELKRYSWPGNVRELRNVVERLMLLADDVVDRGAVEMNLPLSPSGQSTGGRSTGTLGERVESFERETVLSELKRHNYRMTDVARSLGLERSHLYKKCQHLGIDLRLMRHRDPGS